MCKQARVNESGSYADLSAVVDHDAITDGGCSGQDSYTVFNEKIDGKKMAELLIGQGSDPEFFRLNEDGEESEDWDQE